MSTDSLQEASDKPLCGRLSGMEPVQGWCSAGEQAARILAEFDELDGLDEKVHVAIGQTRQPTFPIIVSGVDDRIQVVPFQTK